VRERIAKSELSAISYQLSAIRGSDYFAFLGATRKLRGCDDLEIGAVRGDSFAGLGSDARARAAEEISGD
jgi:hypothetical protein